MRIGIFIGVVGSSPTLEGLVQQAVNVELEGFDSFWTPQVARVDALTLLALAGGRTRRIELGTAVVPTYLRHPLALAQHALTTQVVAGGRLALGIGLSHKPAVEGRWGLSFDRPALHMREYLTVLRDLVREGRTRFDGEMFKVSGSIQVPGATPFPILIAALGPRMLRIAGELSDGTITWMVGLKTLRDHVAPRIVAAAEDTVRPEPRICVGLPIAVTDDPAAARQRAAGLFSRYEELPSYRRMLDIEGAGGPSDVAIVGGEEEVEQRLREISDAGATDLLAVVFPADDDDDAEASVARTRALLRSLVGKI